MIGFVYKIYDNTTGSVYYGSTKNKISQRMALHRSGYKAWVGGKGNKCKSFDIIKNADYTCSLVEQVEFVDKMELLQRERYWIENNECVNKNIPARLPEEYYQQNREQICERQREYDQRNIEQKKEYYRANKDSVKEYNKEHYQANKGRYLQKAKEYYENNKERILEQKTEYRARKKAETLILI